VPAVPVLCPVTGPAAEPWPDSGADEVAIVPTLAGRPTPASAAEGR
jgi:hypothetical protein